MSNFKSSMGDLWGLSISLGVCWLQGGGWDFELYGAVGGESPVVHGPDDYPCPANHIVAGDSAPDTRVGANISVVSHDEVIVGGHDLGGMRHSRRRRYVWLLYLLPVYIDTAVPFYLHRLPWQADDAFYYVLAARGVMSYNNLAPTGVIPEPVRCLENQHVLPVKQVGFHARAFNPEILQHEVDGKEDSERYEKDFQCFKYKSFHIIQV